MPLPSASQPAVSGSSAPMSAMYASEFGSTGSSSIRWFQGLLAGKIGASCGGGGGGGEGGGFPARVPPSEPASTPPSCPATPESLPPSAVSDPPPSRSGAGRRDGGVGAEASVKATPPLHAAKRMSRVALRVRMDAGP